MEMNLTFNKPFATQFINSDTSIKALRVKVQDGKLMVKGVGDNVKGKDVFPLEARTRGGIGITVTGKIAEAFISAGLERGVHLPMEAATHGWIGGEPHGAPGEKPSKIVPTARLWRGREETVSKADEAPARAPRAARKTPAATKASAGKTTKTAAKRSRKSGAASAAAAA